MSGNVQTLLTRQINDWLYGYALSSAYRSHYVYDPDFALSKDPDIWEVIRRDPVIMSAMDRRSNAVVRPWRCIPRIDTKDQQDHVLAEVVEDGLKNIHRFNSSRKRLAEAAFLGRTYAYIEWETRPAKLGGTKEMLWRLPVRLKDIDRRRFHWVADLIGDPNRRGEDPHHRLSGAGPEARYNPPQRAAGDYFEIGMEMYSIARNRWERVSPEFQRNLVKYTFSDTEDRVGYGRGYMEATYFYHYFKTVTFQKIQQGIDRWANGILIGKLEGLRNASTGKTNEDLRKGMKSLLQNARTEHVIVLEDGDDISVVEASGKGHEVAMDTMRYLDEAIERLYNGSVRPSGMGQGATGARAQAETEASVSEGFYQPFREDLDEILSRDLVSEFVRQNTQNLKTLGLTDAQLPRFTSHQERMENRKEAAEVGGMLLDRGIDLVESEFYRRTGWSVPGPGEKTVEIDKEMMSGGANGVGGKPSGDRERKSDASKGKSTYKDQSAKDKKKRSSGQAENTDSNPVRDDDVEPFGGNRKPEWEN